MEILISLKEVTRRTYLSIRLYKLKLIKNTIQTNTHSTFGNMNLWFSAKHCRQVGLKTIFVVLLLLNFLPLANGS